MKSFIGTAVVSCLFFFLILLHKLLHYGKKEEFGVLVDCFILGSEGKCLKLSSSYIPSDHNCYNSPGILS